MVNFCHRMKIVPIAQSPLARGGEKAKRDKCLGEVLDLSEDEVLEEIGEKHRCTVAQVSLAWNLQRGNIVIPKTESVHRITENYRS